MLVNHGTKWAMASIANCNKHPEGTIQYIHAYHSLTHCHAILFPLIFHKHVQVFKYYIINKSWRYILLIFPLISSIIKPLLLFSGGSMFTGSCYSCHSCPWRAWPIRCNWSLNVRRGFRDEIWRTTMGSYEDNYWYYVNTMGSY